MSGGIQQQKQSVNNYRNYDDRDHCGLFWARLNTLLSQSEQLHKRIVRVFLFLLLPLVSVLFCSSRARRRLKSLCSRLEQSSKHTFVCDGAAVIGKRTQTSNTFAKKIEIRKNMKSETEMKESSSSIMNSSGNRRSEKQLWIGHRCLVSFLSCPHWTLTITLELSDFVRCNLFALLHRFLTFFRRRRHCCCYW